MSIVNISAAIGVIDEPSADREAVIAAAVTLKEALREPVLSADATAAARNISRALSRIATSDGLHDVEWAPCSDAVIQGIIRRPEVPWVQRAFAAKALVSQYLLPSWDSAVTATRARIVFEALFAALRSSAEPAEQRIFKEQLLAVAQRFPTGAAEAVIALTTSVAEGDEAQLGQLLEAANPQTHSPFLAAIHRSLKQHENTKLTARIPQYEGRTAFEASCQLSRVADSRPSTSSGIEAWVADLEAVSLALTKDRTKLQQTSSFIDATTFAAVLRAALHVAEALSKLCEEDSAKATNDELLLRIARAAVNIALLQVTSIDSKDVYDAAMALVELVLKTARFAGSDEFDLIDAQIPLAETGLILAKLFSKSKFYSILPAATANAAEPAAIVDESAAAGESSGGNTAADGPGPEIKTFQASLKSACEGALPVIREARKAVQAYLQFHRETEVVGTKRPRTGDAADVSHASIMSSNVCLLVVSNLATYFALGQEIRVTPSWTGGK